MKTVPFYSNTQDNTHCFQAAVRMVLKHCFAKKEFTFEQLDALTGYREGKWTWPMKGAVALHQMGVKIKYIYSFDYSRFGNEGVEYIAAEYGKELADAMSSNSNIFEAQKDAKLLTNMPFLQKRIPTINDLRQLLHQNYLLICWVNALVFEEKNGVVGHDVVVFDCTDDDVIFHDPGLPPQPSRHTSVSEFERAWGYPTDKAKLVIACKI